MVNKLPRGTGKTRSHYYGMPSLISGSGHPCAQFHLGDRRRHFFLLDMSDYAREYHDPEVLRHLYHEKGLTQKEIAKKYGVTHGAVSNHMVKHDISTRITQSRRESFAKKVEPKDSGCWEWTAGTSDFGYGQFWYDGYMQVAHRVSYELVKGDPGEFCVCHKCDNPPCVRPTHLFLGTREDNNKDAGRKGRKPKGESHHFCKLSKTKAKEIKRKMVNGGVSGYEIEDEYEISSSQAYSIKTGKCWGHLDVR